MTNSTVSVRTYPDESSALLARSILEANGIGARLQSDGSSGLEPQLAFVRGIRLIVRREDAQAALELLEEDGE